MPTVRGTGHGSNVDFLNRVDHLIIEKYANLFLNILSYPLVWICCQSVVGVVVEASPRPVPP